MSGDIQVLSDYLNAIGITGVTTAKIQAAITSDENLKTPTGEGKITISSSNYPSHIDFSQGITHLTSLGNLKKLSALNPDHKPEFVVKNLFKADDLTKIDTHATLTDIHISNMSACIKQSDLPNGLTYLKLEYNNVSKNVLTDSSELASVCTGMFTALVNDTDTSNKVCTGVKAPKHVTIPKENCSNCGGGTLCIKSVEIKVSKLVITTESCGSNPPSTSDTSGDTSGDTSSTESQGTGVSYSSCTSCGNNKTLLRNKVDEVKDDSSLLYNRDSNNEVCNHCLVSIGDEKHCNRFLEKEECNYLGDSYNWVGA